MVPDLDLGKPDPDPVLPDPDPVKSGSGSVWAGSRSGLRIKRHSHGSIQALNRLGACVVLFPEILLQEWSIVEKTQ